jgi:UDP-N-acetyl-2-amino-2-deoxyglucuronate dehydrogenase
MKFALIGCGRISGKHIDAIRQIEGCQLVAVCDKLEERARSVGTKAGVPHYTDYHEMLKKEHIDIVNVLVDSGSHARVVIDIAQYKKHIVVEKPMALQLSDADKMIRACDKYGVKLFVVKQNRYNKAIQQARKALDAGRLGKLVLGTVRVRWMRTQEYYDQDPWRGTWWGDGGVLSNQASHHIDMLEWFFGDVESVMCMTKTQLVDIETEDTAVAILKFTNGALGVIEATTAARPKDLEGSVSVLGEKGTVVVGGFAMNQIETWMFSEMTEEDKHVVESYKELPPNVYGFGHVEYLRDVVKAIHANTRGMVDGLEGRKSLELINALYESAETGKEVFLRFTPRRSRLGEAKRT